MTTPSKDDVLRVAGEPVARVINTDPSLPAALERLRVIDCLETGLHDLYTEAQLLAMYAAGADGCSTQAAVAMYLAGAEESRAALAAADERIRVLEGLAKSRTITALYTKALEDLAAERAISDKLVTAVGEVLAFRVGSLPTLGYIRDTDGSRAAINSLAAALAEVAAIRKAENPAVKTYCGGKPNYVNQEKA